MSTVTIALTGKANGFAVTEGQILLPRAGAWHADLTIDCDSPLSGKVDIRLGDSGTLKGTIVADRTAVYQGMLRAQVVAGGDGLRKDAKPQHFTTPTIGVVLAALAKGVGEAVSATAAASVTGVQLEHWTTVAMPAGEAITRLLQRAPAGTAWRLLPDGTIWVGAESWPDAGIADADAVETGAHPEHAAAEIGLLSPWVLPGTTVGGRKVDTAQLTITGGAVKTQIWAVP